MPRRFMNNAAITEKRLGGLLARGVQKGYTIEHGSLLAGLVTEEG
ncbi:hypothetical protein [Paenibacillus sp. JGP012]|nr:hypothetical protein [Paenibacillus sp. JGP012]